MTTIPSIAAIVLLRDDGAALMQHRDDKAGLSHAGMWTPPGGHCEPSEGTEVCARREFLEETAYRLDDLHFLTEFVDDFRPGFPPLRVTVYWSFYDGVQRPTCHEGQALAFIRREEVRDYPIPEYLVALWDRALAASNAHTRASGR